MLLLYKFRSFVLVGGWVVGGWVIGGGEERRGEPLHRACAREEWRQIEGRAWFHLSTAWYDSCSMGGHGGSRGQGNGRGRVREGNGLASCLFVCRCRGVCGEGAPARFGCVTGM